MKNRKLLFLILKRAVKWMILSIEADGSGGGADIKNTMKKEDEDTKINMMRVRLKRRK